MDNTLPDDLWKDSFDKLLEPQTKLREQNLLKRSVRASFNLDSSVENSLSTLTEKSPFNFNKPRCFGIQDSASISTPIDNRKTEKPFKCTISPITSWKLLYFEKSLNKNKENIGNDLEATNLNPKILVDDFDKEKSDNRRESLHPEDCIKKTQKKRQVCFQPNLTALHERRTETLDLLTVAHITKSDYYLNPNNYITTNVPLQPGKWRKSLCAWKRKHNNINDVGLVSKANQKSVILEDKSVEFVDIHFVGGKRKSVYIKSERISDKRKAQENCKDYRSQLLTYCKQSDSLPFGTVYTHEVIRKCKKLGEGAFGEVFVIPQRKVNTVLKIIPIEGSQIVNGEIQKTFEQILPEIIISKELSDLRKANIKTSITSGFVVLEKVTCVQGKYPSYFIQLWEDYDKEKGSENENPKLFDDNQLYVVLELEFAGQDLSNFLLNNAEQAYYVLKQIIFTIAAGEEVFQFEHRDLHLGNILLSRTTAKSVSYKIKGEVYTIPTKWVKVTIIDYTLSRITYDGCCLFNDLSSDEELFQATGDYQFDIYRMMREVLNNKWDTYEPKTNVFWISYIISKMINGVAYKSSKTKTHLIYMDKLRELQTRILDFQSALDCAKTIVDKL